MVGAALLNEEGGSDGLGEARLVALGDGGVGVGREEVLSVSGEGGDGGVDVGLLVRAGIEGVLGIVGRRHLH